MSAAHMKQSPSMDPRTVKLNRIKLLAIFGVAVVPVILAMTMYFGGMAIPSHKTNKGNLLWPPLQIDLLGAQSQSGNNETVKTSVDKAKKWTLLITGGNECDQQCDALIHTVRQVNVSMAKEMDRVNRILASSLPSQVLVDYEQKYPHLLTHLVEPSVVKAFSNEASKVGGASNVGTDKALPVITPWQVWIVDPLGNVVVQYTDKHTGYDMIHDLKKLLKLSNIG